MGASSWYNFTSYDPDPNAALQRLRQEVFETGNYTDPFAEVAAFGNPWQQPADNADPENPNTQQQARWRGVQAVLNNPLLTPELRALLQASMAQTANQAARRAEEPPGSIDELLEEAAEDGTHSILDITHISTRQDFAAAIPLPARDLQRYFGTAQPTHLQAEAQALDIAEPLGRWEAYNFTVYRDGVPDEYAFVGCSGD